jgi:flagellar hook-basal body complex protein FliE
MSSPFIDSALQQMRNLSAEAAGTESRFLRQIDTAVGEGGFAEELRSSIDRISELQAAAKAKGKAFQAGEAGISLPEVMVESQKASVAFQAGVQVRNRLVNAYKEIMNMQV